MSGEKQLIYLIGLGTGAADLYTREAGKIIEECDCIIGSERMAAGFKQLEKPVFTSYDPDMIKKYIERHRDYQRIAVLFSGDIGFYSGAKRMKEVLDDSFQVVMLPGISSVIYLAARTGTVWQDARLISGHGRSQNYIYAITHHQKTFMLCGNPDWAEEFCEKLSYYQLDHLQITIGRNLSYREEEIVARNAGELKPEDLEGLTVLLIENPAPVKEAVLHISDEEFIRGKVPMTKAEIRAITLSKLKLTREAVFYDIGAGTGSVAVEGALQAEGIRVYAIEKKPEGVSLIRQNCQKFKADQVTVVAGSAPAAMVDLEPPTHAFIGGSSGNLRAIIAVLREKNPEVRIALNAISLETLKEVMELTASGELKNPQIIQVAVSKTRELAGYHMMSGENPIFIIWEEP